MIGYLCRLAALMLLPLLGAACASKTNPGTPVRFHLGSPWISASVNGQQGQFLLDTGATVSVLDEEFASRTGIPIERQHELIATTGTVPVGVGTIDRLEIDQFVVRDLQVGVRSFGGFRAPNGLHPAGLIGGDLLGNFNMVFDVRRDRFQLLYEPAPSVPGLIPHRLEMVRGLPAVQAELGDLRTPIWARLDTGSGFANEAVIHLDIAEEKLAIFRQSGGELRRVGTSRLISLAGTVEQPVYEYGPVALLGRRFPVVRVVVHDHGQGTFAEEDQVLVSGSLLRQFSHVEIDIPRRRVWTAP